jgi:hypothetical protein
MVVVPQLASGAPGLPKKGGSGAPSDWVWAPERHAGAVERTHRAAALPRPAKPAPFYNDARDRSARVKFARMNATGRQRSGPDNRHPLLRRQELPRECRARPRWPGVPSVPRRDRRRHRPRANSVDRLCTPRRIVHADPARLLLIHSGKRARSDGERPLKNVPRWSKPTDLPGALGAPLAADATAAIDGKRYNRVKG